MHGGLYLFFVLKKVFFCKTLGAVVLDILLWEAAQHLDAGLTFAPN